MPVALARRRPPGAQTFAATPPSIRDALTSWLSFCRRYLFHLCPKPFCGMHEDWEDDFVDPAQTRIMDLAPREHAKTTLRVIGKPLYKLTLWKWARNQGEGIKDPHIGIFSVNGDVAKSRFRQIRNELEGNTPGGRLLNRDFGRFYNPNPKATGIWTDSALILEGANDTINPTLVASGWGGTPPGARLTDAHLDDLTDPKHVQSSEQREKLLHWVNAVTEMFMVEEGVIDAIATPWHPRDLPMSLKAAGWSGRRWPAIINEQEGIVQWPEQWPLSRLIELRKRIGSLLFQQQMQCEPYDPSQTSLPELQKWRKEWFTQRGSTFFMQGERLRVMTGVDPVLKRKESKHQDRMGIVTVGLGTESHRLFELHTVCKTLSFWNGVQAIVKEWQEYHPELVLMEVNNFQESYRETLERWSTMPIEGVESLTDKFQEIITTYHPIAHKFYSNPDSSEFHTEWETFPGEHDDALDGGRFAVKRLQHESAGFVSASIVANARKMFGAGPGGIRTSGWDSRR